MYKITRDNAPSIKKQLIKEISTISYESLNLNLINKLIQETITEYVYSTIDLLTLLRENYHSSLKKSLENIPDFSNVRFNCYYASKVLKEKLENFNIETKFISYKSIGFSSPVGDNLIKEAHMALLLLTKKNNDDYYLILDPGYRLPEPIGFNPKNTKSITTMDNDIIEITATDKKEYPFSMTMTGYNRYSTSNTSYECQEFFNANYETLNPKDILFPLSYKVLDSYRTIRFSEVSKNRASIKINLLDKYLECLKFNSKELISFTVLKDLKLTKLIEVLTPYTEILRISPQIIAEDIHFIINNNEEFINTIISKEVISEKIKMKSLK